MGIDETTVSFAWWEKGEIPLSLSSSSSSFHQINTIVRSSHLIYVLFEVFTLAFVLFVHRHSYIHICSLGFTSAENRDESSGSVTDSQTTQGIRGLSHDYIDSHETADNCLTVSQILVPAVFCLCWSTKSKYARHCSLCSSRFYNQTKKINSKSIPTILIK